MTLSTRISTAGAGASRIPPGLMRLAKGLWLPLLVVGAWWFLSAGSTSFYYPPLSEIVTVIGDDWLGPAFFQHMVPSLTNLAYGLAISATAGIGIGLLLGRSRYLYRLFRPLIDLVRSVPGVALIPIILAIMGPEGTGKVVLIVATAIWPILLNTTDGVRGYEPGYRDVATVFGISPLKETWFMVLPSASPQIMVGVRISVSLGIIVMVVSEMYAASAGIGYYVMTAQESFRVAQTWAGTIILGVLGYVLSLGVSLLERRVLRWHRARTALNQTDK